MDSPRTSSRARTPSRRTLGAFEQERERLEGIETQMRDEAAAQRDIERQAEVERNRPGIVSRAVTKVSECINGICSTFAPTGIAQVSLKKTKICEWGLTELATAIFKKDFLNEFERERPNKTAQKQYRNIWELGQKPSPQCNAVILDSMATQDNRHCWLCGEETNPDAPPRDYIMPSCDHILPIAQAVLFLGLFKSENAIRAVVGEALGQIPPAKDSAIENFQKMYAANMGDLRLEYGWAHLGCNLQKVDKVFIRLNPESAALGKVVWEVDKDAIRQYFVGLKSSGYVGNYSRSVWYSDRNWAEQRIVEMSRNKLDNIVSTLNARPNESTIDTLYKKSMERCTFSADPRGADYLNMQITLTAWEIFGERIPAKINQMFNVQRYLPSFLKVFVMRGPKLKGEGRTKKVRGKYRYKRTQRIKKH